MLRIPDFASNIRRCAVVALLGLVMLSRTAAAQSPPAGGELLVNGDFRQGTQCWLLNTYQNARAKWQIMQNSGPIESTPALQVTVDQTGTENWHVLVRQGGLNIVSGNSYQFSLWAKSAQPSVPMSWNLQQADAPFRILLARTEGLTLSDRWQQYTKTAQAIASDPKVNLNLIVGFSATTIWLASVSLKDSAGSPVQQPSSCPEPSVAQQSVLVDVALPVPMPSGLRITPPGASIPANRAAFSGVWVGKWDNQLDIALAIREITPIGVAAVYGWGTASSLRVNQPGWTNTSGRFSGPEELIFQQPSMTYKMRSDGRLDAQWAPGTQFQLGAILTKVFPK